MGQESTQSSSASSPAAQQYESLLLFNFGGMKVQHLLRLFLLFLK